MAMIKCQECGHEISDKAKTCPNCGAKLSFQRGTIEWKLDKMKIIAVFLVVIAIFVWAIVLTL